MMFFREPFRAEIAGKWFHSAVQSIVQNHVGAIRKSLLASWLSALVGLFTAMCTVMLLQEHFSRKLFSAFLTRVRFQSQMDANMHVESHPLIERFGAVWTEIFLFISVEARRKLPINVIPSQIMDNLWAENKKPKLLSTLSS